MLRTFLFSLVLLAAGGCDTDGIDPTYTGPDSYAYTLTQSCFCVYSGPLRITVADGDIVSVVALSDPQGTPQDQIEALGKTLPELTALAERAEEEADEVTATYDPTYGFPTRLDIDWIREAVDDEVTFTATDFEAR